MINWKQEIKACILDLDDTLLDTSGLLVQRAYLASCKKMIQAGLNANIEQCQDFRKQWVQRENRNQIFKALSKKFGLKNSNSPSDIEQIAKIGESSFLKRKVETDIHCFQGVYELLVDLKKHYRLFLVSSGDRETQLQKLGILKLSIYFDQIYLMDPLQKQTKQEAFQEILQQYALQSKSCLSIGNRIDNEIAEAKALGMQTCWLQHGEYSNWQAMNKNEIPDQKISNITELRHLLL